MSSRETIEIAGVGPIREDEPITIPLHPGFVVLTGWNGAGKSETLDAVLSLMAGEGSLSVNRDSTSGFVRGAGVEIKVGRQTRRSGELRVKSLQGIDPMEIIDPGIKDPVAADGQRIRVLSKLVGAKLTHDHFAALVGGPEALREFVSHKTLAVEGAPEMAAAFERDFQKVARDAEEEAKVQEGRAEGLRQSNETIDTAAPCDEKELAIAAERALRALHTAEGEAKAASERRAKVSAARQRLEAAAGTRGGISSVQAKEQLAAAVSKKNALIEEQNRLATEAQDLEQRAKAARVEADHARELALSAANEARAADALLQQALSAEKSLEEAQALAAADPGEDGPSDRDLADLRATVDEAKKREKNGVLVREARARAKDAEAAGMLALERRQFARQFREAAANCDELLSAEINKLAPAGIKIRGGRLVGPNKHGELVVFDELSDGERLRIVLPLAIAAVGPEGVMVMPQGKYQDLDPLNREEIERILIENCATIVTATAGIGTLRVEGANGNGAA